MYINHERAVQYFRLGEQYIESAKQLLSILLNNGNSNTGIGLSSEEAYNNLIQNASHSDMFLFIPAIFISLQGTELFIKGLLLLNDLEFSNTHDIQTLLDKLQLKYSKETNIYREFKKIYFSEKEILKNFRRENNITDSKALYSALRYPEKSFQEQISYNALVCNGDNGIKLFQTLLTSINNIKDLVKIEYDAKDV